MYVTFSWSFVTSPYGVWGRVWYLIVTIPDICLLPYFLYSREYRLTRITYTVLIFKNKIVVGCPLGVPISYYSLYTEPYFINLLIFLIYHNGHIFQICMWYLHLKISCSLKESSSNFFWRILKFPCSYGWECNRLHLQFIAFYKTSIDKILKLLKQTQYRY